MHWVERWHEPSFERLLSTCQDEEGLVILGSLASERYAYIGCFPFASFQIISGAARWNQMFLAGCPWSNLKMILQTYVLPHDDALPPFQGGVVGYFGYELAHTLETFPLPPDLIGLPDCVLHFYGCIAAYDHGEKEVILIATGLPQTGAARAHQARDDLARLKERFSRPVQRGRSVGIQGEIVSNFTQEHYYQAVTTMQAGIRAGEFFQANLTQHYTATLKSAVDKLAWYEQLRRVNPASFSAYIRVNKTAWILSCSPERFIRLKGRIVQTEPIKGTIKRCLICPETDQAFKQRLIESQKDHAENVMIVDLMRNDLSRVCLPGTVKVKRLCEIKTVPNVHHLVSEIEGELSPQHDAVDLLKATFPPGSVTGAPKVKALEWLSEMEQQTRGPYCGALGYLTFSGDLDLAVTIRTYVVHGDRVFFGAGGAITLGSDPKAEYEESVIKVNTLSALLNQGKA